MLARIGNLTAILFVCAALAGCATSRSEIKLGSPVATTPDAAAPSGRIAVIRSVTDERIFEQAPGEASTPSLGFEGADKATADIKARAIGRKRGGFGKALGDVLLQEGQTVESVVRENLAAALRQAGYQVRSEGAPGPSTLFIDVRIKQFWSWIQPGFWSITVNANIATDLALSGAAAPTTVSVHAEDSRQIVTDGTWMEIVAKALDSYRAEVVTKAKTFP